MSDLQEVTEYIFPLLDAVRQEYHIRRILVEVTEEGICIKQMFADGETVALY